MAVLKTVAQHSRNSMVGPNHGRCLLTHAASTERVKMFSARAVPVCVICQKPALYQTVNRKGRPSLGACAKHRDALKPLMAADAARLIQARDECKAMHIEAERHLHTKRTPR